MNAQIIANKRVKKRRNFFLSLILWPIISTFLFLINLLSFNGEWWVLFPITIWGLGLFFQALELFGWGRAVEKWENKKIRQSFNSYHNADYLNLKTHSPELVMNDQKLEQDELV